MREAGKTPCGARQNRGRAAGPLNPRVSSHHAALERRSMTVEPAIAGVSRKRGEINDHRPGVIRGDRVRLIAIANEGHSRKRGRPSTSVSYTHLTLPTSDL